MPDAHGNLKGVGWSRAKAEAWDRVFGPVTMAARLQAIVEENAEVIERLARGPGCQTCAGTGMIPDPDRGSGWGPYWDTPCACNANRDKPTGGQ